VVAEIRGPTTTSRAGACSNWRRPSEARFVTDRLAEAISATQLHNGRRDRTKPFRQAGSLPYGGSTAVMMLKNQLREDDESVRLNRTEATVGSDCALD
jgi:hypothetical protein